MASGIFVSVVGCYATAGWDFSSATAGWDFSSATVGWVGGHFNQISAAARSVQHQISRALNCGNRCTERCEGERRYRTLISQLGLLATMRRVVNYHSSWARQQQVELFDASGNPGFTAGRGFNPAGGAPGGG
ncbi:Alpha-glucan water dikinase, chloroplast [Dorcoceras hygrometricum]|uniref:Alpha-glucan water dikinase, chloroplast n=1 Tax=Dorcoceras hygrometricum TaxID=472368 RepID=A0A2Z7B9R2_9LAMI|nr:Alpha-glucan water dikinase, chloroplast [Dorcoceras hygrometricum]